MMSPRRPKLLRGRPGLRCAESQRGHGGFHLEIGGDRPIETGCCSGSWKSMASMDIYDMLFETGDQESSHTILRHIETYRKQ